MAFLRNVQMHLLTSFGFERTCKQNLLLPAQAAVLRNKTGVLLQQMFVHKTLLFASFFSKTLKMRLRADFRGAVASAALGLKIFGQQLLALYMRKKSLHSLNDLLVLGLFITFCPHFLCIIYLKKIFRLFVKLFTFQILIKEKKKTSSPQKSSLKLK